MLREQVVASLRRLGTDSVDLMQMHWEAEDDVEVEVYWQALLDMKAEGLYRAVGLQQLRHRASSTALRRSATSTPCSRRSRRSTAGPAPTCCRGAGSTTPA